MLKSLRGLDPRQADRLLSDAVQRLLPQPDLQIESVDEARFQQVLRELSERVGIESGDLSTRARTQLLEALVEQISASVLAGSRKLEAKRRLGNRGDLRPDLYQVRFARDFDVDESRGVRRRHVEDAIRQPDAIEHLPQIVPDSPKGITFVSKTINDSSNPFILLVQAVRDGDTLTVITGLRVYPSDVDIRSATTPLDIYVRFIEKYGLEFRFGALGPTKYLLNAFVHHLGEGPVPDLELIDRTVRRTEGSVLVRLSSVIGAIYVATAYAIDSARYRGDLLRHGVHVRISTGPQTYISTI